MLNELKGHMTNLQPRTPPRPPSPPPEPDVNELLRLLQPKLSETMREDVTAAFTQVKAGVERALAEQNARTCGEVWNALQPILDLVTVIGKHTGFTIHADLQMDVDEVERGTV